MRNLFFFFKLFFALTFLSLSTLTHAAAITPEGQKLASYLDGLDVTDKWLPHHHVNWRTGLPDNKKHGAIQSHCSAFVAAAAARLDVYILRPPEHAQALLANAQHAWLQEQGRERGWTPINDYSKAQDLANRGCLVVASFANQNNHKPGHIAVVRPSTISAEEIKENGPEIIQAGLTNYNATSTKVGFAHHAPAFQDHQILFFAHSSPYCHAVQ